MDTGGEAAVATLDTDLEERFLQLPGAYDSILDFTLLILDTVSTMTDVGEVTEGVSLGEFSTVQDNQDLPSDFELAVLGSMYLLGNVDLVPVNDSVIAEGDVIDLVDFQSTQGAYDLLVELVVILVGTVLGITLVSVTGVIKDLVFFFQSTQGA